MNTYAYIGIGIGVLLALRGLDEYVRDLIRWFRLKISKRYEKCDQCSGVGMLRLPKPPKRR